jgi:hypothetical protein
MHSRSILRAEQIDCSCFLQTKPVEIFGIPPLAQKQGRAKDGAPIYCWPINNLLKNGVVSLVFHSIR